MSYSKPDWLNKKMKLAPQVLKTKNKIKLLGLNTVCESARCPNISECFGEGVATFLILGDTCTRNCAFCSVKHAVTPNDLSEPDIVEGEKIARYVEETGLRYAVLTSVTRDDLADGGAGHFIGVVGKLKSIIPDLSIEILIPDFKGDMESIRQVASLPIEVFAHNIETVEALYPGVRKGADYKRSLKVLYTAKKIKNSKALVKTGIMVGLGEKESEIIRTFKDLVESGVDILTIGQYLMPAKGKRKVREFIRPSYFKTLEQKAKLEGILNVFAAPYIRSSFLADRTYRLSLQKSV